jgi:membrane-bound lytic murein transglycosylase MltF
VEVCEQHPMWCNRRHRVGANPNRLTHENVMELTTDKKYPKRVTSYVHARGDSAALYVRGIRWFDDTVVLDLDEPALRSLGERLIEMADAALSEQAVWKASRARRGD